MLLGYWANLIVMFFLFSCSVSWSFRLPFLEPVQVTDCKDSSEMIGNMLMGTLNPTHSLTHWCKCSYCSLLSVGSWRHLSATVVVSAIYAPGLSHIANELKPR